MFRHLVTFGLLCLMLASTPARAAENCLTIGTADVDVIKRIAVNIKAALDRSGYCTEIVFKPSLRVTRELADGRLDGDLLRTVLYEKQTRDFAIRVPEPHMRFQPLIATLRDDIHTVKDLGKAQIGIYRDQMWMAKMAKFVPADQEIPNYDRLFEMLKNGHIDTVLLTPSWKPALQRKVPEARIVPMKMINTYLYLHKRHRNLVGDFAKAIATYKAEGGRFAKPPSG